MLKKLLPLIMVFLTGSLELYAVPIGAALPIQINLKPNCIRMGATFDGTTIFVTGEIPVDSEVLIRLVGHFGDTKLKKKGRALGFLWMNMGTVEFRNIPSVFLLLPSNSLEKLLRTDKDRWQKLGLGFEAIEKQTEVIPASEDKHRLFEDFLKLKESTDLYGIQKNRVQYGKADGSMKTFTASMSIPSAIPQGSYNVQAFVIKNAAIVTMAEEQINAAEVGFPAALAFLAYRHATLYGVLAVVVAIIAGLLTGLVFKGAKGGH